MDPMSGDLNYSSQTYSQFGKCSSLLVKPLKKEHINYMDRVKRKKCLRACAQCADSHHPAPTQNIIRAFTFRLYIMRYPMILLADSGCLDQTTRMRGLILAFAVRIFSFSHGAVFVILFILCWGFTAQSTQWVMSSAVSLPNHTFTGQP